VIFASDTKPKPDHKKRKLKARRPATPPPQPAAAPPPPAAPPPEESKPVAVPIVAEDQKHFDHGRKKGHFKKLHKDFPGRKRGHVEFDGDDADAHDQVDKKDAGDGGDEGEHDKARPRIVVVLPGATGDDGDD
jgi:hypothetical protein